jgi:hypothetical protein
VFWEISINMAVACASREFSSNSLTMEQGSEMTEVEPIARTVVCGRAAIGILSGDDAMLGSFSRYIGPFHALLMRAT